MDRMTKQNQAFVTLVNKQLEPFNKTYTDVKNDKYWYTKFVVTPQQEIDFIQWGVNFLQESLDLTQKQAEMEMNWFVLQWGLKSTKVINTKQSIEETQSFINSLKKSK